MAQVIPDGSNHGETAVLVFQAGPPYEDIAFKIVNKDWEFSHKRGFKCSFERGIMHLYIKYDPHSLSNASCARARPLCVHLFLRHPQACWAVRACKPHSGGSSTAFRGLTTSIERRCDGRSFKRFRYRR
jgi:hypothetical protein